MIRDILDKYCVLLKKEVFEDFSSYALLVELKHYLPSLKSEILLNCLSYENNKKEEYLKYVINEITNSTFDINYSENNLKKWLVKYDISLDKILNDHITHEAIYNKLNADYNKYDGFENGLEKQLLFNIQDEFNKYFSKIYANYVIDFCISNIPLKNSKIESLDISENNYKDTYFDKFCEIIDDYTILKKSTAIGVMVDLEDCIKRIKSETLLELQNKGDNRNDYLDYLINEIEKQDYSKNADVSYIQKWLDEYKITIEEIFNRDYRNNSIEAVIDRHYNDMDAFSPEKDKALLVQTDFYQYICKHYADELIAYFNSKKDKKQANSITKIQEPMKPFKDEYLNAFCKEISNERDIYQSTFIQCYDFGIRNFTEKLKSEINENILILPSEKISHYIDFVEDKIKETPYFSVPSNSLNKWIDKYNLQDLEFPYLGNKELKQLISMSINFHHLTEEDRELMEDIQIDFYCYAAMIEANKMIDFLQTKKSKSSIMTENSKEEESTSQLSVNQVIILLDRLGLFSSTMLENLPNTKKAKLISQIIGKNDKNIKTAIEKLELKPNEIKPNHQKDIDKIERILNNLE
ncbi:hypothetical protein FCOL_02595 [Flavobacterium columnare ATCC 49512]|uniref:Uncharacterized protein n=1 Tax=Flavobacterium columnare (strain ATCC 49512 / CIP 103533 / TG 44/87) TaxID=1041826 RepID=G8X4D9_FLACA|nr:hypothetical protein [Flavobacterium columnare]AEW85364.1 hypothetical protein FCOL_02595 [Flavobacterium columnare ATCC 49512]